MDDFSFQNFALEYTRMSTGDFIAAAERYFRYRGMNPNTIVVEKHFLDFLHFLDLEEMLKDFHNSVEPSVQNALPLRLRATTSRLVPRKKCSTPVPQEPLSRVKHAIVKLKTIQVR